MRWAWLSGSMVTAFLTCTLASRADALPVAGVGQAVAPLVSPAAHKPNQWYWHGHWRRPGPWADHVIYGVVNPRGHGALFIPWGADRLGYCPAKYRSFDPATGTYLTRTGMRRVCR